MYYFFFKTEKNKVKKNKYGYAVIVVLQ